MPDCSSLIVSEETGDYIIEYNSLYFEQIQRQDGVCISCINDTWCILYTNYPGSRNINIQQGYYSVPKLYGLMDTTSFDASGITATLNQPLLNVRGQGVLIGFLDTGIDYLREDFKASGGRTRIAAVWDQTIQSVNYEEDTGEAAGTEQYDREQVQGMVQYGTVYTREDINAALAAEREGLNPYDIVPSRDENGHGTFLASIAAGNRDERAGFSGAAPQASIAMEKLKPAKQYLRDFYLIQDGAEAYQENDIMMGVSYLYFLARKYSMPLVVCIPLGTNIGSHMGMSRLGQYLNQVSLSNGSAVITAAGNETGARHHFRAVMDASTDEVTAELRVGEREAGFSMELWAENMGVYTVGFISPTGEVAREISVPLRGENTVSFLLEQTQITVYTQIADVSAGSQFIFMRFENPMSGIWRILIRNSLDIRETFHLWLPVRGFITDETYFLRPDPDTIITDPGNARYPITVTAYDHTKNSIYIHASRGYSLSGRIKPDLAAPGVNILGASVSGRRLTRMSGTSVSAAHLAGAAAILFNWGVLNANYPYLNTPVLKSIFVRGAQRNPALTYPNREFGYGTLNLYEAFLHLRNL